MNAEIAELTRSSFQRPADTLYIGGGSPACIGMDLCEFLAEAVKLTGRAREFTVEINPADADERLIAGLADVGVNRISIGAQSFIQSELDFLGRKYSVEKIYQTIAAAKKAGFTNIGLDLIFAVPDSNTKSWKQILKEAIQADVQHISTYSLTYEKNTLLTKMKLSEKIKAIDDETDRQMYEVAIEELAGAGFKHYEISNFARPGFECRHNLVYWKNDFYLGIGPSAASYFDGVRTENISDINRYTECIENGRQAFTEKIKISPEERACQTAVLNLRLIDGIDLVAYKQKTGFDIYELFGQSIRKNLESGLVEIAGGHLRLTKKALPVADSVLCDFAEPD